MAITINGSGTIGGVSVGGLPDGIVDTDMLASNAVTTTKITDGNVTSAKVGSLGASNLPAGSVLQVVHFDMASTFSTNSTSYVDTGLGASITPSSTSSKILISVVINGSHKQGGASVGMAAYYQLWSFVSGGSPAFLRNICTQGNISNGSNGADIQSGSISLMYLHSPNTTSEMTYDIYAKTNDSTWSIYFSEAPGGQRWTSGITLMEIAG